jgi:hypothetical protein
MVFCFVQKFPISHVAFVRLLTYQDWFITSEFDHLYTSSLPSACDCHFCHKQHLVYRAWLTMFRDRPFNLKGGLWFFVSFRNFFSDNTRVRIFIFFVAQSAKFCSRIHQIHWLFNLLSLSVPDGGYSRYALWALI